MAEDPDYRAAAERIVETVFEVHPQPDYRTPMPLLLQARDQCVQQAAACESPAYFERTIGRFLHILGDPHVRFSISARSRVRAPVWLTAIDGLPVVGDVEMDDLPVQRGDAILAVQGRDAPEVLHQRLERIAYIQGSFGILRAVDDLLTFDATESPGEAVDLVIAGEGGRVRRTTLPLMPPDAPPFLAFERTYRARHLRHLMEVTWRDDRGAAVLAYRSCQDRESPGMAAWGAEVGVGAEEIPMMAEICASLFPDMRRRHSRHLIVELRSNGGGSDHVAAPLYPNLFDGPLQVNGARWRISQTAQSFREDLRQYPLGERIIPPRSMPCHGTADRFSGEVTVLINGGTFSSGETVAQVLRDNGRATFVGEPTGCGVSAGNVMSIPFPEVAGTLRCGCSFFPRPGAEQGAVYPDILVRPTLADFRAGRDPVLEAALARI